MPDLIILEKSDKSFPLIEDHSKLTKIVTDFPRLSNKSIPQAKISFSRIGIACCVIITTLLSQHC